MAFDYLARELLNPSENMLNLSLIEMMSICLKIESKHEIIKKLITFISVEQLNEAFDFIITEEDNEKDKFQLWPLLGLIAFVYIRLGQFNRLLKLLRYF